MNVRESDVLTKMNHRNINTTYSAVLQLLDRFLIFFLFLVPIVGDESEDSKSTLFLLSTRPLAALEDLDFDCKAELRRDE